MGFGKIAFTLSSALAFLPSSQAGPPPPSNLAVCDPTATRHVCVSSNSFIHCGPSVRSSTGFEFLFDQEIQCAPGTVCESIQTQGVQSIICNHAAGGGVPELPGPPPVDVDVGVFEPCDAALTVAACTSDSSGVKLCSRTPYGDFFSTPATCGVGTFCADTTVNGVGSAGCTERVPDTTTPSGPECDISITSAQCTPGIGSNPSTSFQLCTPHPSADGSFTFTAPIPCAANTACTPFRVNGVDSVVCQTLGVSPPPPSDANVNGGGLLTSVKCDSAIAVSRCDPATYTGIQLCFALSGSQGFYTKPTVCPGTLVCKTASVSGVGSNFCGLP